MLRKVPPGNPDLVLERTPEGLIALKSRDRWTVIFPEGAEVWLEVAGDNVSLAIQIPDDRLFLIPDGFVTRKKAAA